LKNCLKSAMRKFGISEEIVRKMLQNGGFLLN
jgi:hypothetical protein